jgi:NhaP-type Na+/H+ and K+/H+ antiporter
MSTSQVWHAVALGLAVVGLLIAFRKVARRGTLSRMEQGSAWVSAGLVFLLATQLELSLPAPSRPILAACCAVCIVMAAVSARPR